MIEQRLRDKERSGELGPPRARRPRARGTRHREESRRRSPACTTATHAHLLLRPHFTLDRNILGRPGRAAVRRRHKEPLDIVSLSRHLLFFDARDPARSAAHAS